MKDLIDELYRINKELVLAADALARAERHTKMRIAELRLDESIDGKNAEVREAQYTLLSSHSEEMQDCIMQEDTARTEVALLKAEQERLRQEISFAKRELDLKIACHESTE